MQGRPRHLLITLAILASMIAALPAVAGPAVQRLPRGPGLTSVPFASGPVATARQHAVAPTDDPVTVVDRYSGFVDGCDDAGSGPDVRRLFLVVDPAADAELSLMLCDGVDPRTPLPVGGSYTWIIRSGDNGENGRRIDAVKNSANDFTIQVQRFNPTTPGVLFPEPSAAPRWRMSGSGPAPRLVVLVDAGALGLGPSCDPTSATPCLAMTFSVLADDTPTDTVPDGQAGQPNISNRHSLFWPSPCGVTTGAPQGADTRALLHVAPGRASAVAEGLVQAGYPAVDRGGDVVAVEAGVDDAAMAAMAAFPDVTQARRHARRSPAVIPTDPMYDGGNGQWYLPRVGAPAAWDVTTGSSSVRIGIVDDGIDGTRPDFGGRVGPGYDAVNETTLPAGMNSDMGWHGTAVAAVAGATGSTSGSATGMAGVDWGATLVPIRVWSHNRCFDEMSYLRGLQWARSADLDVLNLSLGGADTIGDIGDLPGEQKTLSRIVRSGTIVVAAAGNNAWVDAPVSYPAALPDVIAVGATALPASGGLDQIAPYSNQGRYVDVVAPGGAGATRDTGILTATDPTVHGAAFGVENGTSFSAPIVAGAAGLYRSVRPGSTPAEFVRALLATAEDLGVARGGFDEAFGFGMLDLAALVRSGQEQTSPSVRTAGNDRFDTAAVSSRFAFPRPANVDTVVLATGSDFPDALAGAPFAARRHGPILLTQRDGLPQSTIDELLRLQPDDVVLLGGPNTIGAAVEAQLAQFGWGSGGPCDGAMLDDDVRSTCRLAGPTRFETAATVASVGWNEADVLYVATGGTFPDALSGGATAAAFDAPLLLTAPKELPAATRDQIARLGPAMVVVLGGEVSVAPAVLDAIAAIPGVGQVVRASGPDRYATAAAALCPQADVCVQDTRYVTVATGAGFADALSGSAVAAALRAPLLLADPNNPGSPPLLDAMDRLAAERAVILGGLATLPASVEGAMADHVVR